MQSFCAVTLESTIYLPEITSARAGANWPASFLKVHIFILFGVSVWVFCLILEFLDFKLGQGDEDFPSLLITHKVVLVFFF